MMSTSEGNSRPKRSLFDNPFIAEQVQRAGIELDSRVSKIEEYLAAQESIQSSFAAAAEVEASVPITAGAPAMRTERITLEIVYCSNTQGHPATWDWSTMLLDPNESVRVVDTHAEEVAQSVAWEGARDAYRGRIARLTDERDAAMNRPNRCPECNGEGKHDSGGTDASGEWINLPCDGCGSTGTMHGYVEATDKLRARVAELESQLENEACRKANWEKALELAAKFRPAANAVGNAAVTEITEGDSLSTVRDGGGRPMPKGPTPGLAAKEILPSVPANIADNENIATVKASPRSFRYSVQPNGFITELVTVAVTYCPDGLGRPAYQWDWQRMLSGRVPGESIRAVEDVGFTLSDHEIEWLKHMETQVVEREAIVGRTRFTLRSILNRYEAFKNSWNLK